MAHPSPRYLALAAVACLGLAVGSWLLLARERVTTPPAAPLPEAPPSELPSSGDPLLEALPAPESSVVDRRDASSAEIGSESESGKPHDSEQLAWRVLDAVTDAPCPRARVAMIDRASPSAAWSLFEAGASSFEIASRIGSTWGCDEQGRFVLPATSAEEVLLFVESAGRTGERRTTTEKLPPNREILISRPKVRVRVVDASGAPLAGVPIALHRPGEPDREPIDIAHSNREGIASLWHTDLHAERFDHLLAMPAWPLAPAEPVSIPIKSSHGEPVPLVLEPCGALIVRVRDESGAPVREGSVSLLAGEEDAGRQQKPVWDRFDPVWPENEDSSGSRAPLIEGEARFARVAVGRRFHFAVRAGGHYDTQVESRGPQTSGETCVIDIDLSPHCRIRARLLDAERAPLAGVTCKAEIHHDQASFEWDGDADEQGEIGFEIDPREMKFAERAPELRLYVGRFDGGYRWSAHFSKFDLELGPSSGAIDLGTLVLPTNDLIVAGRVVDADGLPVPGAEMSFDAGENDVLEGEDDVLPYLVTNAEGRFRVSGQYLRGAQHFSIEAKTSDACRVVPYCSRGASDLEIRLERFGSLSSTLRLPPSFSQYRFGAELTPEDGRPLRPEVDSSGDGTFLLRWKRLRSASYALRLFVDQHDEPVLSITNIVVRAGEAIRDTRVEEIDLRGRLKIAVLEVTAAGEPLSTGLDVWRLIRGERELPLSLTRDDRLELVILDGDPATVVLAAPPVYASRRIDGITDHGSVALQRAELLTIEIDDLPAASTANLMAFHHGKHSFNTDWAPIVDGTTSIPVALPGEYGVGLWIDRLFVPSGTTPTSVQASGAPGERVRLRFDRAAYERALQRSKR